VKSRAFVSEEDGGGDYEDEEDHHDERKRRRRRRFIDKTEIGGGEGGFYSEPNTHAGRDFLVLEEEEKKQEQEQVQVSNSIDYGGCVDLLK